MKNFKVSINRGRLVITVEAEDKAEALQKVLEDIEIEEETEETPTEYTKNRDQCFE